MGQAGLPNWYDGNCDAACAGYELVDARNLHGEAVRLVRSRAHAIDVGAGSGRDAAFLASEGFRSVTAVEPSSGMRRAAAALRPGQGAVRWIDAALPTLGGVLETSGTAGLVLVSGVWQHVPQSERPEAMQALSRLLDADGILSVSLRHSSVEAPGRGMHPVSFRELRQLAGANGLSPVSVGSEPDSMGRTDVTWTLVLLAPVGGN